MRKKKVCPDASAVHLVAQELLFSVVPVPFHWPQPSRALAGSRSRSGWLEPWLGLAGEWRSLAWLISVA